MFIAACQTPYKPYGSLGGYQDYSLGGGRYRVSFYGNAFTSEETVYRGMLIRCAEIADEQGAAYFTLVGVENRPSQSTFTTPGQVSESTNYYAVSPTIVNAQTSYSYTPPTSQSFVKHSFVGEMQILQTNSDSSAYSVVSILSMLR